jgi:hypothetical protein
VIGSNVPAGISCTCARNVNEHGQARAEIREKQLTQRAVPNVKFNFSMV